MGIDNWEKDRKKLKKGYQKSDPTLHCLLPEQHKLTDTGGKDPERENPIWENELGEKFFQLKERTREVTRPAKIIVRGKEFQQTTTFKLDPGRFANFVGLALKGLVNTSCVLKKNGQYFSRNLKLKKIAQKETPREMLADMVFLNLLVGYADCCLDPHNERNNNLTTWQNLAHRLGWESKGHNMKIGHGTAAFFDLGDGEQSFFAIGSEDNPGDQRVVHDKNNLGLIDFELFQIQFMQPAFSTERLAHLIDQTKEVYQGPEGKAYLFSVLNRAGYPQEEFEKAYELLWNNLEIAEIVLNKWKSLQKK